MSYILVIIKHYCWKPNPNPRPTFQRHTQTICLLFWMWVSLSPCFVYPWWILWLGTSGFTNCRELLLGSHGYWGKFPASSSCVALWSFIVPSIQHHHELHIRKILSRETKQYSMSVSHVTVLLSLNHRCFSSWENYRRRCLCVLFRAHNIALEKTDWKRI